MSVLFATVMPFMVLNSPPPEPPGPPGPAEPAAIRPLPRDPPVPPVPARLPERNDRRTVRVPWL